MCGISGILDLRGGSPDLQRLRAMNDSLTHRGPDGEGEWLSGSVALGHRRLAIIDLSTGQQPMCSEDGALVIVFNGEIYNYLELKRELEQLGCRFRTSSDTEVILQAYATWGVECLSRFNGMWAFALWDARQRALFLARDAIGEKPLHYAVHDGSLVFGSEIKALHAWGIPKQPRPELLEIYLTLGYIPSPHTFFRHISKLRPGCYLWVQEGRVSEHEYWVLPQIDESAMRRDEAAVCEEFEALLRDSVALRMRSDVPYGAFLSGGLDSSSLVALMTQTLGRPVETFTIGFAERDFDERRLARMVAERFHANYHEQLVDQGSFDESLAMITRYFDEPFGDSAAIPTSYVSAHARQHVKMVLTGDGGDEVLSGYTIYQGEKFAARYQRLPRLAQHAVPAVAAALARPVRGRPRYKLNRVVKVCNSAMQSFPERLRVKLAFLPPVQIAALLADRTDQWSFQEWFDETMRDCRYQDPFYRLMYFQFRVSLPDQMLAKVDRTSMAHSLEARVPFLDRRLVEMMARVHKNVKMPGTVRKHVLRRTVARLLPSPLLSAPKRGFVVPLREWFKRGEFNAHFASLLESDLGLRRDELRQLVQRNATGAEDNGNFIWMLFVMQRWLRNAA